jgi:hypothetical protein
MSERNNACSLAYFACSSSQIVSRTRPEFQFSVRWVSRHSLAMTTGGFYPGSTDDPTAPSRSCTQLTDSHD